jgi:hypothetical protein
MSESSRRGVGEAGGVDAGENAPTEDELRTFGCRWIEYLDLDPDEVITYRRPDGSALTFPLGDVAIVSPHSVGAFNRLGELVAEHGSEHALVVEQAATIMEYVDFYRGPQTPPAAG